jgi:hypothetical protein
MVCPPKKSAIPTAPSFPVSPISAVEPFEQVAEPVDVQTLVPKPAIEALHVSVLHQLAWLNVIYLDLALHAPGVALY